MKYLNSCFSAYKLCTLIAFKKHFCMIARKSVLLKKTKNRIGLDFP